MTTVYKYAFALSEVDDLISAEMPKQAIILSVGNQNEQLCLWAAVNPKKATTRRMFAVVGTGNPIPEGIGRFIGTVQFHDGKLILHVFER